MVSKILKNLVFPVVVLVVAGFLLWVIQRDRVSLTSEVTASGEFPREQGVGRFFAVKLRNSGTKQVENINVSAIFNRGAIESTKMLHPELITAVEHSSSKLSGMIPLLNPDEVWG